MANKSSVRSQTVTVDALRRSHDNPTFGGLPKFSDHASTVDPESDTTGR